MENILYFLYFSYLVNIVIFSIYGLIVIKSWGFDYHISIYPKPYKQKLLYCTKKKVNEHNVTLCVLPCRHRSWTESRKILCLLLRYYSSYYSVQFDKLIHIGFRGSKADTLQLLSLDFAVKDLGTFHYFLGVEVLPVKDGTLFSQQRYIRDLLHKTNMESAKPVTTPMSTSSVLSAFTGDPMEDPSLY